MEQKELSSTMENSDTFQISQEHGAGFSSDAKDSTGSNSDEKVEAINKISPVHGQTDFKQTAKYNNIESYVSQHHHSIGTGLYLTDEVLDLPPRFRNKVIQAVESLAAINNIPLDRNPLEVIRSFSNISDAGEKNPDPLVCPLPVLLKNEEKDKNDRTTTKLQLRSNSNCRETSNPCDFGNSRNSSNRKSSNPCDFVDYRNSNSRERSNPHNLGDSSIAPNSFQMRKLSNPAFKPPDIPVDSHTFSKNKTHFNSESHTLGSCRNKYDIKQNKSRKERSTSLDNVQNDLCVNEKSDSIQSDLCVIPNLQSDHSKAHIKFYSQLLKNPSDVMISIDGQSVKPQNDHKSNSFNRSSLTAKGSVKRYNTKSNESNKVLDMKNASENILYNIFPDLMSVKSQDSEKKSLSTYKEKNSSSTKSSENFISQGSSSHLELSQTYEESNKITSDSIANNVNTESNNHKKTHKKSRMQDEYYDKEKYVFNGNQNSLNSQSKYSAINSFSGSKNKSDGNVVELNKKPEPNMKKVQPDIVSNAISSDKNCAHKTFHGSRNVSGSTKYSMKNKFSKPNCTGLKEFTSNEKSDAESSYVANKKNKSNSNKESKVDMSWEKGNLSKNNTPVHGRYSDSKSSVASSYSSSKSCDYKDIHHDKLVSHKDLSHKQCNSSNGFENTYAGDLYFKKPGYQQIEKNITSKKSCKYNKSNSSDTSSVISDASLRMQKSSGYGNLNEDRQNNRNYKHSDAKYYNKFSNRHFDERGNKFVQNPKLVNRVNDKVSETNYESDSSKDIHHSKIDNNRLKQSDFNKEHSNSNQNNFEKVKCSKENKQYNSQDSNFYQEESSVSEYYKNRCIENGFFIKVEVFEETKNIEYWLNSFRGIFSYEFELERCCHFSDILILEFERKEHAIQSLIILHQQKKKLRNSTKPHIVYISTLIFRLAKPCSCVKKLISDCITYIKKHFESSLRVVKSKVEEIQDSKCNATATLNMHETFEDSILNFTQFKKDILKKVIDADNLKAIQQHKHSFIRECNAFKRCLPIYSKKQEILNIVRFYSVSVIVAETGSGKSTQLVEYLQHTEVGKKGLIICTQPRKLAAISIAQFVSGQIGSAVGKIVGYDVGIERKCCDMTKIIYMTDYCLLKRYLKNKDLKGISCIIIDEAHERSLYTDLILGMLKQCLDNRPDLRVIITSATINPAIFVDYFKMPKECILEVPGRSYPVDVKWYSENVEIGWDYVKACVQKAYEIHVQYKEGDILVFLTSPSESDEAIFLFKQLLSSKCKSNIPELLCLHGKTDIHEQMQIFQNAKKTSRKIVFATNVAETAVTIPGIKFVVDSGMTKELMFNPKMNKSYLAVNFINKSAAEQRRGRAGRTQSGICYRMYSKRNYAENMVDNAVPEILKTNLQKALLKIFEFGIDPEKFDFIEAPPKRTISNSVDSLEYLGAIENKKLTEFGRKISKLPLEPQLSKLVLQGIEAGIGYETIIIAALLSESGKLFIRNEDNRVIADEKKRKFCQQGGDLCTFLEIYKRWEEVQPNEKFKWCIENFISLKALNAAVKTVNEILFSLRIDLGMRVFRKYNHSLFKKQYEKVLFDSFSENLCVLSGHPKLGYLSPYLPESFFIHPSSTLSYLGKDSPEFLVYNTLMETSRNFLFDVTPISEGTIKLASQTGSLKLPLHSLKCLQVPPKVMGPFGESVLIRHILGKQGCKIKDLEAKIQELTKVKNVYVDVAVDKGLITIYLAQRFHEKVSSHINQIIDKSHTEMLKEEDVIKQTNTSMHFALGAGGLINDIIMPGEYRELIFSCISQKNSSDIENLLKNYGSLQSVHHITGKREVQICVTYKKVCEAQNAFLSLNKDKKYNISPKPYLPNVSDKSLPLYILNISWCCRPSTGYGCVEFSSEDDLIVASSILTSKSFFLDNNFIQFTPSENNSKELSMKNLPKSVETSSIRTELSKCLPEELNVKNIEIFRESNRLTDADVKVTKQKLSKLLSQHISCNNFVIEMKYPKYETMWNAAVYFYSFEDFENVSMKLKNNAVIDSCPLSTKQVFKSSLYCKREIYNAVSKQINHILEVKKAKGLCDDFSVKQVHTKYNLNVEFSCITLEQLIETKKKLTHFLQGESMDFIGNPKYHFLFSDTHVELIEKIQIATNTFISVDKVRKVITLYGSSSDCQKAKERIHFLVKNPDYSYTRTFSLKDSCIPFGFLKNLYIKYGYDLHGLVDEFKLTVASIDSPGHTLTLKGLRSEIKKAEHTLEKLCEKLFESKGERQKSTSIQDICSICLDPLSYDFQRLEHCGHAFCRQCLLLQLESKTMPLICVKQNCEKLIFLEDIKRIISFGGVHLKKAFCDVALHYHVSRNVGKLSYCPTPDCGMIYKLTKEDSEYNCPSCRNSTCTRCQIPYHYGMSCEMFQNCQNDEDYSLKTWVKENESAKYCPSCKNVIEKESGCNHMECLYCKRHFCWLCFQVFPTGDEVYDHLPYCLKNNVVN